MFQEGLFNNFDEISIWSDGGPKHFKITACMSLFSFLQSHSKKKIVYNFFESHHGHSVCDGVAKHAKEKLQNHQRHEQEPVKTSSRISELVNEIRNHQAHVAPSCQVDLRKFKTFTTIRSFHCFKFAVGKVTGWDNSTDGGQGSTKTWEIEPFDFIKETRIEEEQEEEEEEEGDD